MVVDTDENIVLIDTITVDNTHQKIGLAVVVNYQADRFKQHLDT